MTVAAADVELDQLAPVRPQVLGSASGSGAGLRARSPQFDERARQSETEELSQLDGIRELWFSLPEDRRWGAFLAIASASDVFVSSIVIFVAIRFGYRDTGVSLFCLACQALSHLSSSLLLLLRLFGDLQPARELGGDPTISEVSDECLLQERHRQDLARERQFAFGMGIIMWLSAVMLLVKAGRKYLYWEDWYEDHAALDREIANITAALALSGFILYTLQAAARYLTARHLRNDTFWNAFIISLVSLVFLVILAIAASYEHQLIWKAEPAAASVLALCLFIEGGRVMHWHKDEVLLQLLPDAT